LTFDKAFTTMTSVYSEATLWAALIDNVGVCVDCSWPLTKHGTHLSYVLQKHTSKAGNLDIVQWNKSNVIIFNSYQTELHISTLSLMAIASIIEGIFCSFAFLLIERSNCSSTLLACIICCEWVEFWIDLDFICDKLGKNR